MMGNKRVMSYGSLSCVFQATSLTLASLMHQHMSPREPTWLDRITLQEHRKLEYDKLSYISPPDRGA